MAAVNLHDWGTTAMNDDKQERLWLTVPEAAERVDRSEQLITDWARKGKITAERAARKSEEENDEQRGVWLIYLPSLLEYIEKYGRNWKKR
jgi:hypothetical protein